ncbi:hypothetical protein [Halomonas sp. AOP42-E1-30]|uniref:hypothetical protein n=1 Tax=Halomonas sp. AOP42-E1-30 TaxID=3457665 RepID=UPI003FDA5581
MTHRTHLSSHAVAGKASVSSALLRNGMTALLAHDDIVRPELRNNIMLAGDRTQHAIPTRVTPGNGWIPQKRAKS